MLLHGLGRIATRLVFNEEKSFQHFSVFGYQIEAAVFVAPNDRNSYGEIGYGFYDFLRRIVV